MVIRPTSQSTSTQMSPTRSAATSASLFSPLSAAIASVSFSPSSSTSAASSQQFLTETVELICAEIQLYKGYICNC